MIPVLKDVESINNGMEKIVNVSRVMQNLKVLAELALVIQSQILKGQLVFVKIKYLKMTYV